MRNFARILLLFKTAAYSFQQKSISLLHFYKKLVWILIGCCLQHLCLPTKIEIGNSGNTNTTLNSYFACSIYYVAKKHIFPTGLAVNVEIQGNSITVFEKFGDQGQGWKQVRSTYFFSHFSAFGNVC